MEPLRCKKWPKCTSARLCGRRACPNRPKRSGGVSPPLPTYGAAGTHLIPVQDLASRFCFAPLVRNHLAGHHIAAHLAALFRKHGPPLFLKRDNGSPFNCQPVDEVMARFRVLPFNNPPLELGFGAPTPISSVSIYKTHAPGAVSKGSVRNPNTTLWEEVWSGTAAPAPAAARIFTVNFAPTSFPVDAIRFDLNSPAVPDWNEIDAVSISGVTP